MASSRLYLPEVGQDCLGGKGYARIRALPTHKERVPNRWQKIICGWGQSRWREGWRREDEVMPLLFRLELMKNPS